MALSDVFPATIGIPFFPVIVIIREVGSHFAQEDVDCFEGAGGVFSEHDAEVLNPAFAQFNLPFAGEKRIT